MISRRNSVVVHCNDEKKQYFFSTDHCQRVVTDKPSLNLQGFVPTTHYFPSSVVPRPSLPSGQITSKQDVITVFYHDYQEIPNPDPKYQPVE